MRNWITLVEGKARGITPTNEDLSFDKIEDHKIVLDDPANDEVENLEKASPEKKDKILRKVEQDMHESAEPKVLSKEEKVEVRTLQTKAKDHQLWASEAIDAAAEAIAAGDEDKFNEQIAEITRRARRKGEIIRQYRDIMGLDY